MLVLWNGLCGVDQRDRSFWEWNGLLGTGCKKAVSLSKVRTNTIWFQICSKHIQTYTPFVVDPRLKTLSFFELGCSPGSLQQINLFFITICLGACSYAQCCTTTVCLGARVLPSLKKRWRLRLPDWCDIEVSWEGTQCESQHWNQHCSCVWESIQVNQWWS